MDLSIGDTAPDFSAEDTNGKPFVLSEILVKRAVVLAFFPKAFTPG